MNVYGYQLLGQRKVDEAIAVFKKNVKDYPHSWNTYDSLGEAYALKGHKRQAMTNYSRGPRAHQGPGQQEAHRRSACGATVTGYRSMAAECRLTYFATSNFFSAALSD